MYPDDRRVLDRLTSTLIAGRAAWRQSTLRLESGESGPHGQRETEATERKPLTPRVLVQRLFYATLGGRSLGLGIVDRRFGQLGDPINGCDCI